MSLLVYAITDRATVSGLASDGVEGHPVQTVSGAGGLTALVSEHAQTPSFDGRAALAFAHVVESAMDGAAVLPVRFGSLLEDRAELEQMLRERCDELTATLARVAGRVELSVRAEWAPPQPPARPAGRPGSSGQAYMRARAEPQRRARMVCERIRARLDPLAHASSYRVLARPTLPVAAAYLIDPGATDTFARHAARLEAELDDVELTCTGPWPAYSFVGGERG